ncbi:MAG: hypothetical protein AAGA90_06110 [Actinomycetota bacterium]
MEGKHRRVNAALEPTRWWTLRREVDSPLLQPLLAAVGAMILLHLLEARDLVDTSDSSMAFSLAVDRGLGEVLGYLITGAIIAGFVSLGRRYHHDRVLYGAAGLFTFALADDLLMIHERLAATMAETAGRDVGAVVEIGFFLIVGGLVLGAGRHLLAGASPSSRFIARWTTGFLVVFAVLSVGGSALVELTASGPGGVTPVLVAVSDGGELVVLALLASFVLGRLWEEQSLRPEDDPASILDRAIIDLKRADDPPPGDQRREALPRR